MPVPAKSRDRAATHPLDTQASPKAPIRPCDIFQVEYDGVMGLNRILFGNHFHRLGMDSSGIQSVQGFVVPKAALPNGAPPKQEEPRLVLIKGEPGTGKSLLCAQLLHHFTRSLFPEGRYIRYVLMNEQHQALRKTMGDFFDWTFGVEQPGALEWESSAHQDEATSDSKTTECWVPRNPGGSEQPAILVQSNTDTWYPSLFSGDLFRPETIGSKDGSSKVAKRAPAAVFIDSLNLINSRMSHGALREFLLHVKAQPCLTFIVLEDYQERHSPQSAQLFSEAEFLADGIIHLRSDNREGYSTYTLEVPKMHFLKQTQGKHHYAIGTRNHSTANIEKERRGLIVSPSLHYYISQSLEDTFKPRTDFNYSGIDEFDVSLRGGRRSEAPPIPKDALFVLQGDPSAHMIPFGINLLCGGLAEFGEPGEVTIGNDVLIISLSEEGNLNLFREAMFRSPAGAKGRNIADHLRWRFHDETLDAYTLCSTLRYSRRDADALVDELKGSNPLLNAHGNVLAGVPDLLDRLPALRKNRKLAPDDLQRLANLLLVTRYGEGHHQFQCQAAEEPRLTSGCGSGALFESVAGRSPNHGKKVLLNKWCVKIFRELGDPIPIGCKKVVVASFRPGCITPEQFVHLTETIIKTVRPSRILFDSTALIPNRFPLLHKSELFIPSLVRLFKSKSAISILLDPSRTNEADQGMRNLADYVLTFKRSMKTGESDGIRATMRIENYRNKSYIGANPSITAVKPVDDEGVEAALDRLQDGGLVDQWREVVGLPAQITAPEKSILGEETARLLSNYNELATQISEKDRVQLMRRGVWSLRWGME